jgi:hypothetical protein
MVLDTNNIIISYLVGPQLVNVNSWLYNEFGMKKYAGRTLRIAFQTYNDGLGGVTQLYVDDVSLEVCE